MACQVPGCERDGVITCREHWRTVPDDVLLYAAHCPSEALPEAMALVAVMGWLVWPGRRSEHLDELARLVRIPSFRRLERVVRIHWPRGDQARTRFMAWAKQARARV